MLAAVVAAFLVWDELDQEVLSRPGALTAAFALSLLGVAGGAASWSVLMGKGDRARAADGFISAQPAKYLPIGGVVQIATQIGLSSPVGAMKSTSGLAVTHAALQVLTALLLGLVAFLNLGIDLSQTLLLIGALGAVGLALVLVPLMFQLARRLVPARYELAQVPASRLRLSVALTLIPLSCAGAAFSILAGSLSDESALATIVAFSAAWAVGFVALPIPSGAVVREFVLLLFLDLQLPDLIAVSLAHRTVLIAAEFSLMAIVAVRTLVQSRARVSR